MLKKILSFTLSLVLIAMTFTGCAGGNSQPEATGQASSSKGQTAGADTTILNEKLGEEINMVFIVKSMQMPFFLSMIEGAEAAAKLLPNVNIKCVGPETPYSVEEQIQIIEQAITDGADAVICTPADSTAIVPAVEKCKEAGVLFATPNTKAYSDDVLTYTGVQNVEVGYTLGKALAEKLGGQGNVVLFDGKAGNCTGEERTEGYKKAFAEYPGITLLDVQPGDWNRELGMSIMENWLQKYDKIDGCASIAKDMTMGALEAVKAAGRMDEITFVTFDVDNDVFEAIKAGEIYCTGDQGEKSQAATAIMSAYLALNGYNVAKVQSLPLSIVTIDDLDKYIK